MLLSGFTGFFNRFPLAGNVKLRHRLHTYPAVLHCLYLFMMSGHVLFLKILTRLAKRVKKPEAMRPEKRSLKAVLVSFEFREIGFVDAAVAGQDGVAFRGCKPAD